MAFLITFVVIAGCAWFNRMAGGGWPTGVVPDALRGKWACGVYLGLMAWALHAWPVAIAFGAGFVFWRLFSWGWLIGGIAGGHEPTARPTPSLVEGTLLEWFGPYGGMFARMMFVLPCLIAVAWLAGPIWFPLLAIPFAALAALTYVITWRVTPNRVIENAEWVVGALWGGLIVLA
jgi:hypothetical protein